MLQYSRRAAIAFIAAIGIASSVVMPAWAQNKITFTLASAGPGPDEDKRAQAMAEIFAPAVADFADYKAGYNATLFAQGTELEAISRGNLTMSIASAQELSEFFPEFSIFTAGYVHQSPEHVVRVFNDPLMEPFKKKAEDQLGVKLLGVMYLGNRHINLRAPRSEINVKTPADLAGVNLRMPPGDAWELLGKSLGVSPTPVPFPELYTALSTGSVDGQDNGIPLTVAQKFYEVTSQYVLTGHLVGYNYVAFSKKTWDSLNARQKRAVQKAVDDATAWQRKEQVKVERDGIKVLRDNGIEVYEPDVASFRTAAQAAYARSDLSANWPAGVLEKINKLGK